MKKIFDFGKIDFEGKGKINAVTVEMEYTEKDGKKVFSCVGRIWNGRHSDIVAGGQCLDTIAKYINDPVFMEIFRLWKMYHLNDMHPECEHQAAAGWREKAAEKVTLYHWRLTREASTEQRAAEKSAMTALKAGETFTPSKQQAFIASLSYSLTTHTETLPPELAEYYEPKKPLFAGDEGHTETKTLGWLKPDEHPDGIMCRPCPVCGYKYGTTWNYLPIPEDDEKIIMKLLETGTL